MQSFLSSSATGLSAAPSFYPSVFKYFHLWNTNYWLWSTTKLTLVLCQYSLKKKMQFIPLLNRTRQTSARWHMICGTHTTWLMTHPHSQEDGSQNLQGHLPSIYLGWVLYTWGLLTVKQAMTFASYSGQALPANCCCFIRHNFTSNFTSCKWLERMQAKPNQTNQQQQKKKNNFSQALFGIHHLQPALLHHFSEPSSWTQKRKHFFTMNMGSVAEHSWNSQNPPFNKGVLNNYQQFLMNIWQLCLVLLSLIPTFLQMDGFSLSSSPVIEGGAFNSPNSEAPDWTELIFFYTLPKTFFKKGSMSPVKSPSKDTVKISGII